MTSNWIGLGEARIPVDRLKETNLDSLSDHEKRAVNFCIDWLDNKSSFKISTSGSTGTPKEITLLRSQMIASAQKTVLALDLTAGMTSLVCLDTNYIAGMMMLARSLITGMNMMITAPSSNPFKEIPSTTTIDFAALVPYQLSNILASEGSDRINRVSKIILGGAPIGPDLMIAVDQMVNDCYATYGMTETLSHIALQKLNGTDKQQNFHTMHGVSIRVDERQCLVITTDYIRDEVITNDIVEIVNAKEFKWLGRHDNVINSGGVKISPEKVERVVGSWMYQQNLTNRFFVTSIPHQQLGNQVILIIEGILPSGAEPTLISNLHDQLTRYDVPKQVLYLKQFRETPTGKIDRIDSLKLAVQ